MQPYFFPYIGYYSLIKHTDEWIVFDEVQFIRHGWIERNRILKPGEGWQYVGVPLEKHGRDTLIKEVKVRQEDWQQKLLRQLEHYKKAPYYQQAIEVIREAISIETDNITVLDTNILKVTCDYLQIPFNFKIFSEMNLQIDEVTDAGEWALNISKSYGATTYINPPGGKEIFDPSKFQSAKIDLKFLIIKLDTYPQRRKSFEAGLSIIDVMMFNDPVTINKMLDQIEFV